MSTPNPTHIIAEHWCCYHGPSNADRISYCCCGWSGEDHAVHVVSKLTDAGYSIVKVECDGSGTCPVSVHVHGCFSDDGNNCDNPEDHICDCGTCVAIEAARSERAAAAEVEKP